MRMLKIIEHISLDGVIQHSADDGDVPNSDWPAPYRTLAGRDATRAAHGERFELLLGRRTYAFWSSFWPNAPRSPLADRLNAATKGVAFHHPASLDWGPCEGVSTTATLSGVLLNTSKVIGPLRAGSCVMRRLFDRGDAYGPRPGRSGLYRRV